MVHEFNIRVQPHEAANEQSLMRYIAREKGMDIRTINAVRVLRRSIDARQRIIYVNLSILFSYFTCNYYPIYPAEYLY